MSNPISRSTFLKLAFGCAGVAAGLPWLVAQLPAERKRIPCRMLGPSMSLGHSVRDHKLPSVPDNLPIESANVVIVGGGIAGLAAAWCLQSHGVGEYLLLELEKEVGGNSRSGKNNISAYPWGAHYVPLANAESLYVREFFQECGIITGFDEKHQPVYNELFLCHEPQERLLKDGSFQEGLIPHRGLQPKDKEQFASFFQKVKEFRTLVGKDGKPGFAIPLNLSSRDDNLLALDRVSFSDWLSQNGFNSKPLLWYLNYCTRDDYGSTKESVSAWAGIHYFAGRRGTASNAEMNSVVTWPEGNGFIVQELRRRLGDHVKTGAVVTSIESSDQHVVSTLFEPTTNKWRRFKSKFVLFAAPRFVAPHIIKDFPRDCAEDVKELAYAPWMVANITLERAPSSRGVPLSWDNVSYLSESLGYVVANHQDITTRQGQTVITYYYPLSQNAPPISRKNLSKSTEQEWSDRIVADLTKMHPEIREDILSIDLWPWGHGMVRPSVGFIWGEKRENMKQPFQRIYFAHSDMSGMSNFEEAQYQGITAAKSILAELKLS